MRPRKFVESWLSDRYDLSGIREFVSRRVDWHLPKSVGWWATLGGAALLLFLSQVATGILLLVYYRPSAREAFESLRFITIEVHFGWLFRQLHVWGSHLMVLVILLHLLRTYFTGAYKKPRELTWVVGALILVCTLMFGFTGHLLPWNQSGYWTTTVSTEAAGAVPLVGDAARTLLRGGKAVGAETLNRFFTVHVILLPWLVFFLVALHLSLVNASNLTQKVRVGEEAHIDERNGTPFFPHHFVRQAIVGLFVVGILLTLAILWPFDLGEHANPLDPPRVITPQWYFLPVYALVYSLPDWCARAIEAFPAAILVLFPFVWWPTSVSLILFMIAPVIAMILWPFLDRGRERAARKRPYAIVLAFGSMAGLIFLGTLAQLGSTEPLAVNPEEEVAVPAEPALIEPDSEQEAEPATHEDHE